MENNGIDEGYVYLQVTRGAYGARDFVAPDKPRLTIFMFAEKRALIDTPSARNGSRVVSAAGHPLGAAGHQVGGAAGAGAGQDRGEGAGRG